MKTYYRVDNIGRATEVTYDEYAKLFGNPKYTLTTKEEDGTLHVDQLIQETEYEPFSY